MVTRESERLDLALLPVRSIARGCDSWCPSLTSSLRGVRMSVVYRNRLEVATAIVVGVIASASFITIGLATPGAPTWWRVLLPVGGLLYGYVFVFHAARVAIYETKQGLRVRDWFRSYDLMWSEIQRFELEKRFDWGGKRRLGLAVLQDGSRIRLKGMTTPKLIAALNDALSRARSNPAVSD